MYYKLFLNVLRQCKFQLTYIKNNFYQVLSAKGNFCAELLSTALLIVIKELKM